MTSNIVSLVPRVEGQAMQGQNLRSHKASWKRKPSWPQLRLVDGQSVEFLVVGDPWTFEIPQRGRKKTAAIHHVLNIVLKKHLTDSTIRSCMVWEISDKTFRDIMFDPTEHWMRVTRYGSGKRDTRYEIETVKPSTDIEKQLAKGKHQIDLELVSIETRQRHSNLNGRAPRF